jgi:formylglycine-generating enzyme required for sulfatase activity
MPSKNTTTKDPPAPWAARSGQDAFGAFADLELRGQVQRFRWCPPGSFLMGDVEEGQRNVTLTRGFWMGDTPVTQGLYAAVMGRNPSKFRSAFSVDLPVEMVSWGESRGFIETINGLVGSGGDLVRLPTEAEWEYSARAGTTGERYGPADDIAWTKKNSLGRPHSVGQKLPNSWGLYDMLGNVWEWCHDSYNVYPFGDLVDPKCAGFGDYRIVRGGSWGQDLDSVRSSFRNALTFGFRDRYLGLRLVMSPPGL